MAETTLSDARIWYRTEKRAGLLNVVFGGDWIIEEAGEIDGALRALDIEGAREAELDATMTNLRTATAGIGTTLGNVDKTLESADQALGSVDNSVGSLNTAITSADITVQKIGELSDNANKVVTGQGVAQMTQLVAQTRTLVTSLTRLTNDLQREPTRLIFGDQGQGYTPP